VSSISIVSAAASVLAEIAEEYAGERVDGLRHGAAVFQRVGDRRLDALAVLAAGLAGAAAAVGAIHRQRRDDLDDRPPEGLTRRDRPGRGAREQLAQAANVGPQRGLEDATLGGARELTVAGVATEDGRAIPAGDRPQAGRVDEHGLERVHELVPGGAGDRPVAAQALPGAEDLLDQDRRTRGARGACSRHRGGERVEVRCGIEQPVDVIDAKSRDGAVGDPAEHPRMRGGEHERVLDPHADQIVDLEEAPVVQVVAGAPPVHQAIGLRIEQRLQPMTSLGSREARDGALERDAELGGGMVAFQDGGEDLIARHDAAGGENRIRGAPPGKTSHADGQVVERSGPVADDLQDAAWLDGKGCLAVPDAQPAILAREADLPARETAPTRFGEHRQEHRPGSGRGAVPVNVEPRSEPRRAAMRQDVVPGGIVRRRGLVIRHHVEQQPHAPGCERLTQLRQLLLAAERRSEARWIDDVIAVRAAGTRGQDRRAVQVRNAEAREVSGHRGGGAERKLTRELKTIGRLHRSRCDAGSYRGPASERMSRWTGPRIAPDAGATWRSRSVVRGCVPC